MSEQERELHQNNGAGDVGRARKRKMRRQSDSNQPAQPRQPNERSRASRERSNRRGSQSVRERLVDAQIKMSAKSFPSIQGMLSSKLGGDSHVNREKTGKGKQMPSGSETPARSPRQRKEVPHETAYKATSRTETQRVSNNGEGFQPRKNHRAYEARTEGTPPVMVRGGMGGMAFGRVASSKLSKQRPVKRRIDVPLKVTGAEVRLPTLPFLHLGWRLVSLLMVLMMATSLVLMWRAPVFQVGAIEAKGLQRLTVNDLNAVMGTFGKSVFTLNPDLLNNALQQAFPELSKISVKINLPASVKVVATEREPVISWMQDGVEIWVDAEGVSFPPRGEPMSALVKVEGHGTQPGTVSATSSDGQPLLPEDVTVLSTPNKPTLRLTPDLVASILALGAKMPPDTTLVYDSEHGLGWNDPNGWEVFFGEEDQDMQMKLVVYQALVERLQSEGIQPVMISVEYVHAPYYRVQP